MQIRRKSLRMILLLSMRIIDYHLLKSESHGLTK